MLTIWPTFSLLSHGLGNWWILAGAFLYVGHGVGLCIAAWVSLSSLDAFKKLGIIQI
jgi:hypothetical protein